ncbi:MAG: DNA alkylation repair protein [Muribaculaceae bacterium]|nr:DNA alkylation repair protein [Muribaculaceae bacterium]
MIHATEIETRLLKMQDEKQANHLMRFFKTGKGEYGEGDRFLGIKVPRTREIVKEAKFLVPLNEIEKLLDSPWHEVRLTGFLLLVEEMKAQLPKKKDSVLSLRAKGEKRKEIAEFYLRHARKANNWDLVDLSCEFILGPYIRFADYVPLDFLYSMAKSDNLWEQRISIVTTLDFIRHDVFSPTLRICDMLMAHQHDLIHKATGWMLREIGKREPDVLIDFLERNYADMPRTTLRYAIEKMDAKERLYWLKR